MTRFRTIFEDGTYRFQVRDGEKVFTMKATDSRFGLKETFVLDQDEVAALAAYLSQRRVA